MPPYVSPPAIDAAAHVVQLALTPIFLLTGIASLLNVFSTRLGRIADQVDRLDVDTRSNPNSRRAARLRLRSRTLDVAVLLASVAGALTCAAALTLFVGEIKSGSAGMVLFALFGGALVCAIAALGAFSFETILAGQTVRDNSEGKVG